MLGDSQLNKLFWKPQASSRVTGYATKGKIPIKTSFGFEKGIIYD